MLAKNLKIKNLKRQRKFITDKIEDMVKNPPREGNTSFLYIGDIFPENRKYFEQEGFNITLLNYLEYTSESKGMPIYRFSVKDEIILEEEELVYVSPTLMPCFPYVNSSIKRFETISILSFTWLLSKSVIPFSWKIFWPL